MPGSTQPRALFQLAFLAVCARCQLATALRRVLDEDVRDARMRWVFVHTQNSTLGTAMYVDHPQYVHVVHNGLCCCGFAGVPMTATAAAVVAVAAAVATPPTYRPYSSCEQHAQHPGPVKVCILHGYNVVLPRQHYSTQPTIHQQHACAWCTWPAAPLLASKAKHVPTAAKVFHTAAHARYAWHMSKQCKHGK